MDIDIVLGVLPSHDLQVRSLMSFFVSWLRDQTGRNKCICTTIEIMHVDVDGRGYDCTVARVFWAYANCEYQTGVVQQN